MNPIAIVGLAGLGFLLFKQRAAAAAPAPRRAGARPVVQPQPMAPMTRPLVAPTPYPAPTWIPPGETKPRNPTPEEYYSGTAGALEGAVEGDTFTETDEDGNEVTYTYTRPSSAPSGTYYAGGTKTPPAYVPPTPPAYVPPPAPSYSPIAPNYSVYAPDRYADIEDMSYAPAPPPPPYVPPPTYGTAAPPAAPQPSFDDWAAAVQTTFNPGAPPASPWAPPPMAPWDAPPSFAPPPAYPPGDMPYVDPENPYVYVPPPPDVMPEGLDQGGMEAWTRMAF